MLNKSEEPHQWAPPARSRAKRRIPKASQGHFVGELTFGGGDGQRLGFESLLEYRFAICALYRPGVIDVEEQLGAVRFNWPNGRPGSHHLDLRVTHSGGRRTGIAVKPYKRAISETFLLEMQLVAKAAISRLVDRICIVTERHISRIELDNAKLMHAVRRPDPKADVVLAGYIPWMCGPRMILQIIRETGLEGDGFAAVIRALHRGDLACNRKELLTRANMVWPIPQV